MGNIYPWGRKATGIDAVAWAVKMAGFWGGWTACDLDGLRWYQNGYDIALMKRITDSVNVPVIASGGSVIYNTWQMGCCKVVLMRY